MNTDFEQALCTMYPLVKRYAEANTLPDAFSFDENIFHQWGEHMTSFITWVEHGQEGEFFLSMSTRLFMELFVDIALGCHDEKWEQLDS